MATIDWDKAYVMGRDYTSLSTRLVTQLLKYVPMRDSVLDLGCGTGQLTRELWNRKFRKVTGVDGSQEALKLARAATTYPIEYRHKDLSQNFNIMFHQKFQLITCKDTLAFIRDRDKFFQNVSKLLSKEGIFILISPDRSSYPKERWGITLDSDETKEDLGKYFILQNHFIEQREEFYICKTT